MQRSSEVTPHEALESHANIQDPLHELIVIRAHPKVTIEGLRLCLERSGQAPLDISFYEPPHKTLEEVLPLLSQPENADRIHTLHIKGDAVCAPLLALFRLALPSLRRLEVSSQVQWPALDEHSIPMSFPRLHTLKLGGLSMLCIIKDPAICVNLRSLGLHSSCCEHHQLALADLVTVLKSIHRLETLDLTRFTPFKIDLSASELGNADAAVHLAYLQRYTNLNTTPVISSINTLLSFPMTCAVDIRSVDAGASVSSSTYESSHAAISDVLGPCIRQMLENLNATAMTVCSDDGQFSISIPTDPEGPHAPPRVTFCSSMALARFGDFVSFCPSDRLTHLTFSSIPSCSTYAVVKWAAVLRAYPTLQSITITRAACDVSGLIRALTPLGPGHPEDRQELLCPDLRSIHVTLYTRKNNVLYSIGGSMVSCATARAERGARQLEELTVIWMTDKKAVPLEDPEWKDIAKKLRGLVDRVDIMIEEDEFEVSYGG